MIRRGSERGGEAAPGLARPVKLFLKALQLKRKKHKSTSKPTVETTMAGFESELPALSPHVGMGGQDKGVGEETVGILSKQGIVGSAP